MNDRLPLDDELISTKDEVADVKFEVVGVEEFFLRAGVRIGDA